MDSFKLYKSFFNFLAIYGCIGFSPSRKHKKLTIKSSKYVKFYSCVFYFAALYYSYLNFEDFLYRTWSAHVPNLVATIEIFSYIFPPVFTVLSVLWKTIGQIKYFKALSVITKALHKNRSTKFHKLMLQKRLLTFLKLLFNLLMLITLALIYELTLDFDLYRCIRIVIEVLLTFQVILVLTFITSIQQYKLNIIKFCTRTLKTKLYYELIQLIKMFNDAFELIYFGCHFFITMNYAAVLYLSFIYFFENIPESEEEDLLHILIYIVWYFLPLVALIKFGKSCEELQNVVSLNGVRYLLEE